MPQLRQTLGNLWNTATATSWTDLVPPSVVSTLKWLWIKIPHALGLGTPREQVVAVLVLIPAAILSSVITLGLTLALVVVLVAVLLPVGLARHNPTVNDLWPLGGKV